MNKSDILLSKVVLLERALKEASDDLHEELKKQHPTLANIIRNEVRAINRTHKFFFDTVQPVLKVEFLDDFERFQSVIDEFFKV